jgi:phosphohistidine phosphatase
MKRLLLMRHAHAEAAEAGVEDIDRPLSARGRDEALDAAERIAEARLRCDALLVSPARRTRDTATLVAAKLDFPQRLTIDPELYPGDPDSIQQALGRCPDRFRTVLIVGHNPGISEFAQRFNGTPTPVDLHTAGLCLIDFPADASWGELTAELAIELTQLP